MATSKLVALFFAFAAVAATLQLSEARVQGFTSVDQEEAAPSKAAAQAGSGNPGVSLPLPQIPGLPPLFGGFPFPLPLIPGLPPLFGPLPLPGAPGAPPSQGLPGLPHLPIPGAPGAPPSQGLPGLPHLPIPGAPGAPPSPGLPGLPHFPLPAAAPSPPPPAECLTPLTQMFPCVDYLTNITVVTPPATCCDGLKSVISGAPICLCHGMNGDMSKLFPKPIDPIRMFILPMRCGAMLPLRTLLTCNTETLPPLVPPTTPTPPASPVSPAPPLVGPRSPAPASSPASTPTELSP